MSASMPLDAATPARHALTREQVEAYDRDGFLFPLPVFTAAEASGWAAEIAKLPTAELVRHPAPWVQKSYLFLPSLDQLMRDERLTGRVTSILGDDLLVLSADLFLKTPGSTKRITWHQDVNYWGLEPLKVLTAWVAFTAATPENGCMRYAPGAHRGRLVHIEHKTDDNMLTKGQEIAVEIDDGDAVAAVLSPRICAPSPRTPPTATRPSKPSNLGLCAALGRHRRRESLEGDRGDIGSARGKAHLLRSGPENRTRIAAALLERSVIACAMPQGDILGFAPPLCLREAEAGTIVDAAKSAVDAVAKSDFSARAPRPSSPRRSHDARR